MGVTEPAALALACAKARSLSKETPKSVEVTINSGIYKNAFTCGIPGTEEVGNAFAAALGCLCGDPERGLYVLDGVTEQNVAESRRFIEEGRVKVNIGEITSELFIRAVVKTENDVCEARIRHSHTNIDYLCKNGRVLLDAGETACSRDSGQAEELSIGAYTLEQMYNYAMTVPVGEMDFIREAFDMNLELADAGFSNRRCRLTKSLLDAGGGRDTGNAERTAVLLTSAAVEARVLGLDLPAMSVTGSGNHGIICTLLLYAAHRQIRCDEELLLRATALCVLVTMYIKEYSGKLSAFCGCAIAGGTGAACGLSVLYGGGFSEVERTLCNMANSIVGMICHGGNQGCVMKVISAVKTAFSACELAMDGAYAPPEHGICGATPEETMRNIGYIAVPGMVETEKAVIDILRRK